MKTPEFLCSLASIGLLLAAPAQAQTLPPDSSLVTLASARLASWPVEAVSNNSHLYNGAEYVHYEKLYSRVEGHQFFQTADPQPGDLYYDGARYRNIPLQYDIKLDQIVVQFPRSPLLLRLVNEKLTAFTVQQRTFVRLTPTDTTAKEPAPAGFYEVLAEGRVRVLARRIKRITENNRTTGVEAKFKQADKFYLEKGGQLHAIGSSGALLTVLADKKKELRTYSSAQRLTFKKGRQEASFVALARYYNTL